MTTSSPPKIGVVILNYKNYANTIDCLRSLGIISYPNAEIIVVDNDSQNDSLKHIHRYLNERQLLCHVIPNGDVDDYLGIPERILLIQSESNRGYAAGNNIGIRAALARGANYVLILNNDTLPDRGFLEPLVKYAEARENVGVVGPKVLKENGTIDRSAHRRLTLGYYLCGYGIPGMLFPSNRWIKRLYYLDEGYAYDHPREVDVVSGCCLLIKRCVFDRTGLLDENTFLFLEEAILCERLRDIGMTTAIVPDGQIIHKQHQSTDAFKKQLLHTVNRASRYYYLTQYRHYPRWGAKLLVAFHALQEAILRGCSSLRSFIGHNPPPSSMQD